MTIHDSFWTYAGLRWLRASIAILVAALVAYAFADRFGGRGGDTLYGYTIGTVSALLMVWLAWFGVRKRSYGGGGAPLVGWLSAHVYLGLTLVLLVPLHSDFQLAANFHTLAYALVVAVIVSGIAGVGVYSAVPERMTANRPGEKLAGLLEHIAELDSECRQLAHDLPDGVAKAVRVSLDETMLGGGLLRQLAGVDPRCGTARALDIVAKEAVRAEGAGRAPIQRLIEILSLKRSLVVRVRADIRYKALLQLWLIAHVPLAVASLVAVAVHVFAVFYYR